MSLLRELTDEQHFGRDGPGALMESALLLRRAGLEHLVTDATREEVLAMAAAGERIFLERAAVLARAMQDPDGAWSVIDGGELVRKRFLREALANTGGV